MGSGKVLCRALKKYGPENFEKTILHVYSTAEEMWNKERELVYVSEETYNLKEGGTDGWDYVNSNKLNFITENHKSNSMKNLKLGTSTFVQRMKTDVEFRKMVSNNTTRGLLEYYKTHKSPFFGKNHSDATKEKMRKCASEKIGEKNSQYGTCWITNGIENKKIKKTDLDEWIILGYSLGRKFTKGLL